MKYAREKFWREMVDGCSGFVRSKLLFEELTMLACGLELFLEFSFALVEFLK